MKKINRVGDYEIFEVTGDDASVISKKFGPSTASDRVVASALKALQSGKKKDFLARYPYEDDVDQISDWEIACLKHPLFVFSTKNKDARYKDILFLVPVIEDLESAYFTDDGEIWGDDRWEPLPDIILNREDPDDNSDVDYEIEKGARELADKILDAVYDYIDEMEM